MKQTKQVLVCGGVFTRKHTSSQGEFETQMWIDHDAYMLRHTQRTDGELVVNRLYVRRCADTTFKRMISLYREQCAWSGMACLYVFWFDGVEYTVFSSSLEQAKKAVCKMYLKQASPNWLVDSVL